MSGERFEHREVGFVLFRDEVGPESPEFLSEAPAGAKLCLSKDPHSGYFLCSREEGHEGDHGAHVVAGKMAARWQRGFTPEHRLAAPPGSVRFSPPLRPQDAGWVDSAVPVDVAARTFAGRNEPGDAERVLPMCGEVRVFAVPQRGPLPHFCTLPAGHEGWHVAHSFGRAPSGEIVEVMLAKWPPMEVC